VSGSAFGASVTLLGASVVPPTPSVTLPATGALTTGSLLTIPTNVVVDTGVLAVSTQATNATLANEVVTTSATVADPNVLNVATSLLSATVVESTCSSSATGSTGSTTIANLVVDGTAIPVSDAIDQIPALPAAASLLLSIEINKQVVTNAVGATGITVDALVVTLASDVAGGGVITLSQSVCGATGPDINAPPTVTGVVPNSGPTAGGTTVTITGTGFQCVTGVKFGTTPAGGFTVVSPTQITATSPPGAVGPVDVTVTTCDGTSPTSTADQFTYVAATGTTTTVAGAGATTTTVAPAGAAPLTTSVGVTG
jgi:hypothetical protein